MRKNNQQKGATTLLFMSLLTIIAVLLLTASYSRLLLALKRSVSAGDRIVSTYAAESRINDLIARLLNGYPFSFPFSYSEDIGETKLEVEGREEGANQIIEVTANRNFASSKIRATRAVESTTVTNNAEVVLSLDCTESMGGSSAPGGSTTKIHELKGAVLAFLDSVAESSYSDNYRLGLAVFGVDSKWLKTLDGRDITPANNIPIADIRAAVDAQFTSNWNTSSACSTVMGRYTSIGSGFLIANQYYRENAPLFTNSKRAIVLMTDGLPNSRMPYDRCLPNSFCPQNDMYCPGGTYGNEYGWSCYEPIAGGASDNYGVCGPQAFDLFRCTIAPANVEWRSGEFGDRDPNIDTYGVLVVAEPSPSQQAQYDETVEIFGDYATQFFNVSDATELTGIFENIFETISEGVGEIRIEKIVPGL